jgi:hypothetical protein
VNEYTPLLDAVIRNVEHIPARLLPVDVLELRNERARIRNRRSYHRRKGNFDHPLLIAQKIEKLQQGIRELHEVANFECQGCGIAMPIFCGFCQVGLSE